MFLGSHNTMRYLKILYSVILLCYDVILGGNVLNICKNIYTFQEMT